MIGFKLQYISFKKEMQLNWLYGITWMWSLAAAYLEFPPVGSKDASDILPIPNWYSRLSPPFIPTRVTAPKSFYLFIKQSEVFFLCKTYLYLSSLTFFKLFLIQHISLDTENLHQLTVDISNPYSLNGLKKNWIDINKVFNNLKKSFEKKATWVERDGKKIIIRFVSNKRKVV